MGTFGFGPLKSLLVFQPNLKKWCGATPPWHYLENTNHNEEVKDSVEGVDGVEHIVRTDAVLEVVHKEEN